MRLNCSHDDKYTMTRCAAAGVVAAVVVVAADGVALDFIEVDDDNVSSKKAVL